MILAILGLAVGILAGLYFPVKMPIEYSQYLSVALLAALDSVFGGIRTILEKTFDIDIFLSGFFGNAILAVALTFLGDKLGVPMYYAAIFTFGGRMFQNFAILRRIFLARLKLKQHHKQETLHDNNSK